MIFFVLIYQNHSKVDRNLDQEQNAVNLDEAQQADAKQRHLTRSLGERAPRPKRRRHVRISRSHRPERSASEHGKSSNPYTATSAASARHK